jgi:hypothetical protein
LFETKARACQQYGARFKLSNSNARFSKIEKFAITLPCHAGVQPRQAVSLHKRSTTMGIVNNESATESVSFCHTAGPCLRTGWLAGKCLVRVRPSLSLSYSMRVQHTRGCLPSEVAHRAHALPPGRHTMSTNCTSPSQQLSLSLSPSAQVKRHTCKIN